MYGSARVDRTKRIAAFACAAAAALSMGSCSSFKKKETEKHEVSAPPKLVVMGDSIAAGYGLEGYSKNDLYSCRSYANILGDEYKKELDGKCEAELVNVAVSGDTSSDLLSHLQSGEFDDALKDSDAVVISIGGNDILGVFLDFLHDNFGFAEDNAGLGNVDIMSVAGGIADLGDDMDQALDGFDTNLTYIVAEIRKRTDGEIFIQTLYDPIEYYDDIPLLPGMSADKINRLNEIITENAGSGNAKQYTVSDIHGDFAGKAGELTNIKSYDIHPNAEGHEQIARILEKDIGEKQYYYTTEEEVTDKASIKRSALIGGGILLGLAVIIGLLVSRR